MKSILSTDEVKKIALQEVVDGTVDEIELENKSGKVVYEVEVKKNDIDYDLYIDVYSGEIISVDRA